MDLERQVGAALPTPLGQSCRVLRYDEGQLTLGVPAAAHSAKLRQLAPRLVAALEKQGWQVNGIAVRVQATLTRLEETESSYPAPRAPVRQMSERGRQAFAELHEQLPAGPLADAIERLLQRVPRETDGNVPDAPPSSGDR